MTRGAWYRIILSLALLALVAIVASCSMQDLLGSAQPTATPTRTPRPELATDTPVPALAASLAVPTQTAPVAAPAATAQPVATAVPPSATPAATATAAAPTAAPTTPTKAPPTPVPATLAPTAAPAPTKPPAPAVDFAITELRVLGQGENNGGIEGPGAGRTIFITVLDAAGNPLNGAAIVNTAPYPGKAVSGDKGPGKAEILMDREEFRLKIESVAGAAVSSEVSHTMSLIAPEPQDIVGKLGSTCPTLDNCPIPPYKHFSYVITFRRTH